MKTFLRDGLSLNEFRVASLIVTLFVFGAVGIYSFFKAGDVPPNVVSVISTLVVTIGGVEVFKSIFDSKNQGGDM